MKFIYTKETIKKIREKEEKKKEAKKLAGK